MRWPGSLQRIVELSRYRGSLAEGRRAVRVHPLVAGEGSFAGKSSSLEGSLPGV